MQFTGYKDVERFLFSQLPMYQRVGPKAFKKDLKNIKSLCRTLGHPEKDFKAIHIAGTNGKGSVAFMTAAILHRQGFNVGLYTSPHYRSYRERIRYNKSMIPVSYIKQFVNRLIEQGIFEGELKPSFFEVSVAMAFQYFSDMKVDYAVIETGLGGRLDSTNVVHPVITAITNIDYDHMQFLGNTLELIAGEKAGIIKKGVPLVLGRRQKETLPVFKKIAEKESASILFAEDTVLQNQPQKVHLTAGYQLENWRTAVTIVNYLLPEYQPPVLRQAEKKELEEWGYVGRFQILQEKPLVIADSAHNRGGFTVLFEQLKSVKYDRMHIVLAVVNDKNLDDLLAFMPGDARYYLSEAKIPRALSKEILFDTFIDRGYDARVYGSVSRALAFAKINAGDRDLVLVTGSIFTVAEIC